MRVLRMLVDMLFITTVAGQYTGGPVLVGGQLGNFLNLKIFPTKILVFVTALLVLFVSIRMGFRIFL